MSTGAWVFACLWSLFAMFLIGWKLQMRHFDVQMRDLLKTAVDHAVEKSAETYLSNRVEKFLIEIGNDGRYISLKWKDKE